MRSGALFEFIVLLFRLDVPIPHGPDVLAFERYESIRYGEAQHKSRADGVQFLNHDPLGLNAVVDPRARERAEGRRRERAKPIFREELRNSLK
jgi:hypothetical protein